jgi:predicted dehydrogenase
MTKPSPLALGLVGLDRIGWHLLDRVQLRDDFAITAVWDPEARRLSQLPPSLRHAAADLPSLSESSACGGWIVTVRHPQTLQLISAALQRGQPVWLTPLVVTTAEEWARWQRLAERHRGLLRMIDPHYDDPSFAAALQVVQSGRLGTLQSASWSLTEWVPPALETADAPLQLLYGLCTQWTALHATAVRRLELRTVSAARRWSIRLETADGVVARWHLCRGERAPSRSGWVLHGSAGGFRQDRLYTVAEDGEVIDEPCPAPATRIDPWFDAMRLHLNAHRQPADGIHTTVRTAGQRHGAIGQLTTNEAIDQTTASLLLWSQLEQRLQHAGNSG